MRDFYLWVCDIRFELHQLKPSIGQPRFSRTFIPSQTMNSLSQARASNTNVQCPHVTHVVQSDQNDCQFAQLFLFVLAERLKYSF